MSRTRLALALAAVLSLPVACSDVTSPADAPLPPPTQPTFPATTGPATIYVEQGSLYGLDGLTRFVLYENGAFALQFKGSLPLEFAGRYTRVDSLVTFEWKGASAWGATGTMRGDELVVTYNAIMQLTDFVGGTYVRAPNAT